MPVYRYLWQRSASHPEEPRLAGICAGDVVPEAGAVDRDRPSGPG